MPVIFTLKDAETGKALSGVIHLKDTTGAIIETYGVEAGGTTGISWEALGKAVTVEAEAPKYYPSSYTVGLLPDDGGVMNFGLRKKPDLFGAVLIGVALAIGGGYLIKKFT